VLYGDATRPEVLADARLEHARLVVVAAPDAFQTRAILELARRLNPDVEVVARTHSDEERHFLEAHGAERALVGERELAVSLVRHALRRFDVPHDMEAVAARTLREEAPVAMT
jgi:CPA2 family monovalent cation:H+ antiporter-2